MNPTSSAHNTKSSKHLRLQQHEKKSDFEDFEFSSGLLAQSSTSSTYRGGASHSSSQKLSKNKFSGHSTLKQKPSSNNPVNTQRRESTASGEHKCPHCPKTFSKRFSIQKHVQVCFLRLLLAARTIITITMEQFHWLLTNPDYMNGVIDITLCM